MARSMTAYGRSHLKTGVGHFIIEIHSVNRKSLDIHSNIPKELLCLDMKLRKHLGEEVKRGNVTIRITKDSGQGDSSEAPNLGVMKAIHKEWMECALGLGYKKEEAIPFSSLMQFVMTSSPSIQRVDKIFENELMLGFDEAMVAFIAMKETEGNSLKEDILPRLCQVAEDIDKVKKLTKEAPKRFYERLEKKLEEIKMNHEGDKDRLARELVIFADKVDITEEITRLASHIKQFHNILNEDKRRVGRELDFLTQEMNREVNTITAKSQELGITQLILSIKSELEKIREQLQNIE